MPGNTQEVPVENWNEFFAQFTRENRGSHATLEVISEDVGDQMEVTDTPLDGIAADTKDGECTIWITFGAGPEDHINHAVTEVEAVRLQDTASGPILEIESDGGVKTVLHLSPQGAFKLGPASR
jgi:Family of unknown function (DUF5335)